MLCCLVITFPCFGFSLWALYDATIGYPNQLERVLKFKELYESGVLEEEWPKVAADEGWPLEQPDEDEVLRRPVEDIRIRYEWKVKSQYVMMGVAIPMSLFVLLVGVFLSVFIDRQTRPRHQE